ncbi:hypothetical protein WOLCODRAFT_22338 [Wolfiporia cocos MD-104 SS10]|uniref:Uncharacterized protein n=1 Tax=Wolfiporia cocos (strain MD-104) TaxID=742152 RepID=A0A2H3IVC2_WOLCO|nr:hypothetical protein WOLCODRAFT_22338 [Wolfiporia cocos MD-104 SS10]
MEVDTAQWSSPAADGTWPSAGPAITDSTQTTGVKRPRSPSIVNAMDTPPLTPVPQLHGDIILEVFTHKSLRFPGAPTNEDSEYGDSERLSLLGEKVLEVAITFALFNKRPLLKAHDIESRRDDILADEQIDKWVVSYKMREKVRCAPDKFDDLKTPKETRALFCSYVGAVYSQKGMEVVQDWIGRLIDPDYAPPAPTGIFGADYEYGSYKRIKTETPPPFMASVPPPPSQAPPPLPHNPLAPAQPQAAFLPLFNQTANQRRLAVEYPAQFTGPPHAGRWTVQCVVNGIPKGEGSGASKQLAKEDAARQAFYAMGWAPHA